MARQLSAPNGAVLIGTVDDMDLMGAVTPVLVLSGETLRSEAELVPPYATKISFEVQATPSGTCAMTVTIRTGNRKAALLSSGGATSGTSVFTSFSAAASQVFVIDADTRWVQIEVSPVGANASVSVVAAAV
jgi:hypothetical protein